MRDAEVCVRRSACDSARRLGRRKISCSPRRASYTEDQHCCWMRAVSGHHATSRVGTARASRVSVAMLFAGHHGDAAKVSQRQTRPVETSVRARASCGLLQDGCCSAPAVMVHEPSSYSLRCAGGELPRRRRARVDGGLAAVLLLAATAPALRRASCRMERGARSEYGPGSTRAALGRGQ